MIPIIAIAALIVGLSVAAWYGTPSPTKKVDPESLGEHAAPTAPMTLDEAEHTEYKHRDCSARDCAMKAAAIRTRMAGARTSLSWRAT